MSDDIATLRAMNTALMAENASLRRQLSELQLRMDMLMGMSAKQNERLDELTDILRRRMTTRQSRRRDEEPDDPDDVPPAPGGGGDARPSDETSGDPGGSAKPGARRKRRKKKPRKGGRRPLGQHLPADEDRHAPGCCEHCGCTDTVARDVEVSEKLNVVRQHVRRRRIVRETKLCKKCLRPTTATMPPMPCHRSMVTCSFLAWLVVQKFVLLVPLDRIRRLLLSQGIDLAEPTLVSFIERAADLLGPIDGEHWKQLKAGTWMGTDGTGLDVLLEGVPGTWKGVLDVFARHELTVYQFSLTKHGDTLAAKMAGFEGTVLCDAESRLDAMFEDGRVEANCNAHPRRKFRDARKVQPKLAREGQAFLDAMYRVEKEARQRELTGDDLLEFRQRRTRPVVDDFERWLLEHEPDLLPSDELGKVVRYYLRHFDALTRFVDDADLPIDNNRCERAFQAHAKLRVNALFAGSVEGAHRWATILGVVNTAQRLGVDATEYLIWAFERRGTHRKRFGISAARLTPAAFQEALDERQGRTKAA